MHSTSHSDISVLIVDDESLIRQRIALHVERAGYSIAGFAGDGKEAALLLSQLQADIVITDIAMPFVSGVELLEKARESGNRARFIFITGYNDFAFAISALKNKASDYLLKPVDPKLLLVAVDNACKEIVLERTQQDLMRTYGNLKDASLLYRFLSGADLIQDCSSSLQRILKKPEGLRLLLVHDGDTSKNFPGSPYLLPNGLYLYFVHPGGMEILKQLSSDRTYLVLGNPLGDSTSLRSCFPVLRRTLLRRLLSPDVHLYYQANQLAISPLLADFTKENRELLRQKHYAQLRNLIADEVPTIDDPLSLELYMASLLSLFREYTLNRQGFPWEVYSPLWILERFERRTDYIDYLQKAVDSLCVESGSDASLPLVERVQTFLLANYAQPQLNLETIGLHVFAHPNYVSTRFKEETGMNVIEYLTTLRLEKAKVLLETTSMSCGQIACSVGFQDQGYFSRCFKKKYAYPPNAFQSSKN